MTVQWFPGHMTRAKREIEEKLALIDVVIELVDARIPEASRNPMIDSLLKDKPRIVLLNKSDLADSQITSIWVKYFKEKYNIEAITLNAILGNPSKVIIPRIKTLFLSKQLRLQDKGIRTQDCRVLIVGIPNVGKSTLINQLVGKKIANTGDQPGVTKGQQWIRLNSGIYLLDTPGILWPKFDDPQVGMKLAMTGAIKSEVLPIEEVAIYAIKYMYNNYKTKLQNVIHWETEISLEEEEDQFYIFLRDYGKKRGILKSAGEIDIEKTAFSFLRELRSGKIGQLSFEVPNTF